MPNKKTLKSSNKTPRNRKGKTAPVTPDPVTPLETLMVTIGDQKVDGAKIKRNMARIASNGGYVNYLDTMVFKGGNGCPNRKGDPFSCGNKCGKGLNETCVCIALMGIELGKPNLNPSTAPSNVRAGRRIIMGKGEYQKGGGSVVAMNVAETRAKYGLE